MNMWDFLTVLLLGMCIGIMVCLIYAVIAETKDTRHYTELMRQDRIEFEAKQAKVNA